MPEIRDLVYHIIRNASTIITVITGVLIPVVINKVKVLQRNNIARQRTIPCVSEACQRDGGLTLTGMVSNPRPPDTPLTRPPDTTDMPPSP